MSSTVAESKAGVTPNVRVPKSAPRRSLSGRIYHKLPRSLRVGLRWWVMFTRTAQNYWYDFRRFGRASSALIKDYPQENLRALITMDYHRLEKGLALPEPRLGFGQDVLQRLRHDVPLYIDRFGRDEMIDVTINTLRSYVSFHDARGHGLGDLCTFMDSLPVPADLGCGGVHEMTSSELEESTDFDVDRFFYSRHSIRNFVNRPVDDALVRRAVRLAMESPSVCNRQSWRLHRFKDRELVDKVLSYQNGNRGFGHTAPEAFVVTSDMRAFTTPGERNQCWIDGGMFSMALVLALHGVGLGACCLNWSVERERDRAMRAHAGIPDNEAVIMMIAFGHVPERFLVAQSPRRPIDQVLVEHDP